MVGLTGAICPAFVHWSKCGLLSCTNWQSLLRGNGQAQPSPAESGKAICPGKRDHLQWQLGTTACCSLSHMSLLENLCSCITPSQLRVKTFMSSGGHQARWCYGWKAGRFGLLRWYLGCPSLQQVRKLLLSCLSPLRSISGIFSFPPLPSLKVSGGNSIVYFFCTIIS